MMGKHDRGGYPYYCYCCHLSIDILPMVAIFIFVSFTLAAQLLYLVLPRPLNAP